MKLRTLTQQTDPGTKPPRLSRRLYQGAVAAALMTLCSVQAFAANTTSETTVWAKAQEIMRDVYGQIVTISTIAAVMTACIALLRHRRMDRPNR